MSFSIPSSSSIASHNTNATKNIKIQIDHDAIVDQLSAMLCQEDNFYSQHINLRGEDIINDGLNDHTRNERSRSKICEWAFKVVDHFGYEREVVGVCMNYIDRYVFSLKNSGRRLSTRDYQILSTTALYIAVKLHGKTEDRYASRNDLMNIHTFVTLSRGVATKEIIEEMERSILSTLKWRMNPPIQSYFVSHLLELFPAQTISRRMKYNIHEISRYLSELSVCTEVLSTCYRPSLVAYGCVLNALEYVDITIIPQDVINFFLETVASVTLLRPEMAEVQEVQEMLKGLTCPTMFTEGSGCSEEGRCPAPVSPGQTSSMHDNFSHLTTSPDCVSGTCYRYDNR